MADSDRTSIHEYMARQPISIAKATAGALLSRFDQPTVARPSQCSCSGTTVDCRSKRHASVPAGIPTNAQILYLHDNQITKLEPGVFNSLVALCLRLLRSEELASLPTGVFDKLTQLTLLELQNNQLKGVPRGAFDKRSQHCQERFLRSEKLVSLPAGLFDRLVNLQQLYLGGNQLSALPDGVFDKLTQLTHLGLNNQLKNVPIGAFQRRICVDSPSISRSWH
uniref:Leucine-rich repeat-containing protein 15-like n=4 Tax=Petromyzon marinus TaxID=7757 RepID=A0AAJ7T9Q0_PETMA|nr:leucine-rich repeat-containing protein 15-like [Petromyzon marinus]